MTNSWLGAACRHWRASLALCAGMVCAGSAAGEKGPGELLSRGEGSGAQHHELPQYAVDTERLPYTRLSADADADATLPLYRLGPDSYFLYGNIATINEDNRGFNGNAGFVITDDGVVVIDALGTPALGQRLIATIRSLTDRPVRYLILTHNHPDHAYGASAFRELPNVTVIAHPGLRDYLGSESMQRSVDYRRDLLARDMAAFSPVAADRYVPEQRFARLRVELGGKTFDIYNAGRHHSHGDLVVHQLEDEILWVSDLAFNQRVTFIGDGDSQQILEGHDWLLKTFAGVRLMVPGHGSAQTAPFPMVEKSRAYIEQLRELMQQKIDAGASLLEAVEDSDMPHWRELPLYAENQRANAAFIYRELELRFFEGP